MPFLVYSNLETHMFANFPIGSSYLDVSSSKWASKILCLYFGAAFQVFDVLYQAFLF